MNDLQLRDILHWLSAQGMQGLSESELISGFCEKCNDTGMEIGRALALIDTLHPDFEGRAYHWDSAKPLERPVQEYQFTDEGVARDTWKRSTFHHLIENGLDELRRTFVLGAPTDFYRLEELKDDGHTDYVALIHRFTNRGRIGEMDAFYSCWTTRKPEGFSDHDIAALRMLLPTLALAIKCAACIGIIGTLADVYLGQDAGKKVVNGRIIRGEVETIDAVLWFSDLRNYTGISDRAAPEQIIPFLNDYAEIVISAVQENGGSVLKLIGDGVLAIFRSSNMEADCEAALNAEQRLRQKLVLLNARREAEGSPITDVYLGLHIGEVFYGNIGSRNRLDFTVVGPAVNEVSRIAGMCGSVERHVIVSDDFINTCPHKRRSDMVSLGRFALRGVGRAKELFTLDPEIM